VQLTPRDNWIGWTPNIFLQQLEKHATTTWARWIDTSLRDLTKRLYIRDFLNERIFDRSDLRAPTTALVERLTKVADQARLLPQMSSAQEVWTRLGTPSEILSVPGQTRTRSGRTTYCKTKTPPERIQSGNCGWTGSCTQDQRRKTRNSGSPQAYEGHSHRH
jgi:hypothetical protein